jgi:hypothetical protein
MTRSLTLKREAVSDLTPDDLRTVVTAAASTPVACLTGDSFLVCSDGCTMYGSRCHC